MTVNKQPPTPTQKVAVWKVKYPFLKQTVSLLRKVYFNDDWSTGEFAYVVFCVMFQFWFFVCDIKPLLEFLLLYILYLLRTGAYCQALQIYSFF